MTSANRLTDLRFQTINELKASRELLDKNKLAISRLNSSRAFRHVVRLYDEGMLRLREGDEEQAYLLFFRMGAISQNMVNKADFTQFKWTDEGARFYKLFEQCVNNVSELEESLAKRYDLLKVGKSYETREVEAVERVKDTGHENIIPDSSLTIDPRELMRHVESNHQVLVIDYRSDQSEVMKCANAGRLSVAQIPVDTIVPGCIGSWLIRSVPIQERVLLQRMVDVDLVVLLGTDHAPNNHNDLVAGSKEQILYSALSTYNNNFQPRRPPLFMKGGFENWRLCYPMHTSSKVAISRTPYNFSNRTEFAKAVAKYKKDAGIESIEYPELLTKRRIEETHMQPAHVISASSSYSSISDDNVNSIAVSTSSLTYPSSSIAGKLIMSSAIDAKPRYSLKVDEFRKSILKTIILIVCYSTIMNEMLWNFHILTAGVLGIKSQCLADVNGELEIVSKPVQKRKDENSDINTNSEKAKDSEMPSVSYKEVKSITDDKLAKETLPAPNHKLPPVVDRTVKPALEIAFDSSIQPVAPFVPDRSTKPHSIPSYDPNWLVVLYESMVKTINDGSVRRNCNPGYTGLYNLGNTCFMNATLQALFNTTALKKIFTKNSFSGYVNRINKLGTFGVISSAFSALMDAVWSGSYTKIRPQQFLETFACEVNASLADHKQHDAQEFQIYLLDSLHEDTNRVQKRVPFQQNYRGENLLSEAADYVEKLRKFGSSPVNDIFSCQTVSYLQCNTCKIQSVTFEEVTQLSIEVPNRNSSSIIECLRSHFRSVILDGSCKWHCPRCRSLQIATRTTYIWKLPRVLILHMKRFAFADGGWRKNDAFVKFDTLPLDLSCFMHPILQNNAGTQNQFFTLYAVINHCGSLNSGHYTASAKNHETKQWLDFDDDSVCSINVDSICSKNAFILYYKQDLR